MNTRRLTLLAALFCLCLSMFAGKRKTVKEPDFAYPRTVLKDATASFDACKKSGDVIGQLQALMQINIADGLIDKDTRQAGIQKALDLAGAQTDKQLRALVQLYAARLIGDFYSSGSWRYDSRQLPLTPRPADMTEWSGQQFRAVVDSLSLAAFADAGDMPIGDLKRVVEIEDIAVPYFPTLADFAVISVSNTGCVSDKVKEKVRNALIANVKKDSPRYYYWLGYRLGKDSDTLFDVYANAFLDAKDRRNALVLFDDVNYYNLRPSNVDDIDLCRRAFKEAIAASRHTWAEKIVDQLADRFNQKWFALSINNYIPADQPVAVSLSGICNVDSVTLVAYLFKDFNRFDNHHSSMPTGFFKNRCDKVITKSYRLNGGFTDTIMVNLPAGYYYISALVNGKVMENKALTVATNVAPVRFNSDKAQGLIVNDIKTGKRAAGAKVRTWLSGKETWNGITDSNGIVNFNNKKQKLGEVEITYQDVTTRFDDITVYVLRERDYSTSGTDRSRNINVAFTTNRGVYKLADTVQWLGVATNEDGVVSGAGVKVMLRDNEGNKVDSAVVVSDDYGRITGKFVLPAEARTGRFNLIAKRADNTDTGRSNYGSGSFQVSDFKLAGITMSKLVLWPCKDGKSPRQLDISGLVTDYTDTPVANASVSVRLVGSAYAGAVPYRYYDYWNMRQTANTDTIVVNGVTGVDGRFAMQVTAATDSTNYSAEFTATAPDGSVCADSRDVDMRYPNSLSVTYGTGENLNVDIAKPFSMTAVVVNPAGDSINVPVEVIVSKWSEKADTTALRRFVETTDRAFSIPDFTKLATGKYMVYVKTPGAVTSENCLTLYDSKSTAIPASEQLFWMPEKDIIGVSEPGLEMTYAYAGSDGQPCIYNRFVAAGYHDVDKLFDLSGLQKASEVSAKGGADVAPYGERLWLYAVRDGIVKYAGIQIPRPTQSLKVSIESFRDKVNGGAEEKWTVRVLDADGKPATAALMLDAYDMRLDRLSAPSYLRIGHRRIWVPGMSLSFPFYDNTTEFYSQLKKFGTIRHITAPDWRYLEDYRFGSIMVRGNGVTNDLMVYEKEHEVAEPRMMAKAKSVTMSATGSADMDGMVEDAEVTEELAETVGAAGAEARQPIDFHNTDVYTALWMPLLTADNGSAEVAFRTPNSNTSWQLRAVAWDKTGNAGRINKTFITSKQLMVKLNAPRFVRTGDKVVVLATVTNASPKQQTVTVTLDSKATADADSLSGVSTVRKVEIAAGDNVTLPIDVDVPGRATELLLTVTGRAGLNSDGERISIPVLLSQSRVTETQNFYMNPGQTGESLTVPVKNGTDIESRLTFTDNPMWTIVEALNSIRVKTGWSTADSYARTYFIASTLLALMDNHPELELSLSRKDLEKDLNASRRNLQSLQDADGSMRWGAWSPEGSVYTTENVLDVLAVLKRAGYLRDDKIRPLIDKACRYLDRALSAKYPDVDYTIMRPAFADVMQSVNGRRVSAVTIQDILKNWKTTGITEKAQWTCALWYNDNPNMARTLMGSLDEFGTQTANKGFEFKNVSSLCAYAWLLQAYGSVLPKSPRVDGLRQYLLVRRQGESWGNGALTVGITGAMLDAGTPWTVEAGGVDVSVDGVTKEVATEGRTGNVTMPVDGKSVILTRTGNAVTPAYGALITEYTARNKDIGAYSDGEISITKQLFVQAADGSWKTFDPAKQTLTVGQRVKTQLTIKSDRPMSNVTVTDDRAATLEPVSQLSGWVYGDGLSAYRENRDAITNLYISYLPKGTFLLEYQFNVNNAGRFATGVATATCTQAPTLTAHSAGTVLRVQPAK